MKLSSRAADFALALLGPEAVSGIQANHEFFHLGRHLSGMQNRIAFARQFYTYTVFAYTSLPSTIVASIVRGSRRPVFELAAEKRLPVQARF